jgi:hypothetical protein
MKPIRKRPTLKAFKGGGTTQVYYDSLLRARGIDPATESADRPLTVPKKVAARLIGTSVRTIDRMIADGRAEQESATG